MLIIDNFVLNNIPEILKLDYNASKFVLVSFFVLNNFVLTRFYCAFIIIKLPLLIKFQLLLPRYVNKEYFEHGQSDIQIKYRILLKHGTIKI